MFSFPSAAGAKKTTTATKPAGRRISLGTSKPGAPATKTGKAKSPTKEATKAAEVAPPPAADGVSEKLECDKPPTDGAGDAPADVNGSPAENGAPHVNGDHEAEPAAHVEVGDLLGSALEPPPAATEAI